MSSSTSYDHRFQWKRESRERDLSEDGPVQATRRRCELSSRVLSDITAYLCIHMISLRVCVFIPAVILHPFNNPFRTKPRDLRKLDSLQPNLVPTILSRRTTIIVNMLHIRALIKADTVILFDASPSTSTGSSERPDLAERGGRLKERLRWHIQGNLKALRREEKQGPRSGQPAMDACEEEEMKAKNLSYEHRSAYSIP